jgi:hypothetical protein
MDDRAIGRASFVLGERFAAAAREEGLMGRLDTTLEVVTIAVSDVVSDPATAPKGQRSEWYAAYIVAREHGRTPEEASRDAAGHMESARR